MNPQFISHFVESSFTCFPLFLNILKGFYQFSDGTIFGSKATASQNILFYASVYVCREFLDVGTLVRIFNEKVRRVVYPLDDSVLTQAEEEFATDVIETFPITQQITTRELKKLIISRVSIRNPTEEELVHGKSILEKIPRLGPQHLSQDTLTDFMYTYLSHGASILTSHDVKSMYLLMNLFSSLNTPVPGRLAKPFAWTEKLASRLQAIFLTRRLVSRNASDHIVTPRNLFSMQLQDFSTQVDSPPRAAYMMPHLRAPMFHPQKSPDSPDSFRLSPKPSPPKLSTPLATFLANRKPATHTQREIIVEALQHAGMSPKRSARAADQFLAGGETNVDALRATIEHSKSLHPIAQPSPEERSKLSGIQSMIDDIRNIAAVRNNSSSRS
jgi:hypothetical protein